MSNGIEHDDQLDGNLKKVLEAVRDYETWTEHDPDRISEMDKTITDLIEKLNGQLILIPQNSDELTEADSLVFESVLVVLSMLPIDIAFNHLDSISQHADFFSLITNELQKNPPLRSYAKTLIGRARLLQERQLQELVHGKENMDDVLAVMERIADECE